MKNTKRKRRNKTYYIMCTAPSGSYIYDGYFHGTRLQAIKEVFEEIEECIENMNYCPKCNIVMENEDFYYDEEKEDYINIWICPNCGLYCFIDNEYLFRQIEALNGEYPKYCPWCGNKLSI